MKQSVIRFLYVHIHGASIKTNVKQTTRAKRFLSCQQPPFSKCFKFECLLEVLKFYFVHHCFFCFFCTYVEVTELGVRTIYQSTRQFKHQKKRINKMKNKQRDRVKYI